MSTDSQGEKQESGYETATKLDQGASYSDIDYHTAYLATVNNIEKYGVFVTLVEKGYEDSITGLVTTNELPQLTTLADYSVGDEMVVEVLEKKPDGDLELRGLDSAEMESVPPADLRKPENSVADLSDRIDELQAEIEELSQIKEGISNLPMGDQSDVPMLENRYKHLITLVKHCYQEGFEFAEYNTEITDNGENIEVTFNLRAE